jgi:hypothetical protein
MGWLEGYRIVRYEADAQNVFGEFPRRQDTINFKIAKEREIEPPPDIKTVHLRLLTISIHLPPTDFYYY